MRKQKFNLNVDKLRIGFEQPTYIWENIKNYPTDTIYKYNDYISFKITDDGKTSTDDEEKEPNRVSAILIFDGMKFGTMTFNNNRYDFMCFLTLENKIFYTNYSTNPDGTKNNLLSYLTPIVDLLGLRYKSITELEVCIDTSTNIISKIRKMIKDSENYEMFVNGKKVVDTDKTIKDYGEFFSRTRQKLNRNPTLYVSQADKDTKLKVYDKTREIEEEKGKKNYIIDWNKFGKQNIYRLELTMLWRDIKKWFNFLQISNSDCKRYISDGDNHTTPSEPMHDYIARTLLLLQQPHYIAEMIHNNTNRVLYFAQKRPYKRLSLLEVAIGNV